MKIKHIKPEWFYDGKVFTQDDVTDTMYSFLYIITNKLTNKRYVGKKVLFSKVRKPPLKGKKRVRISFRPSDWNHYWGSCKPLIADLEEFGHDSFKREIIQIFPNKREVNYAELAFQIIYSVLDDRAANGEKLWYNENINLVFYPSKDYQKQRLMNTQAWCDDI
jgi:hypothetical protein